MSYNCAPMRYLVLTALLAVMQTAPSPRKVPDSASGSSRNVKQGAADQQTPSVPAMPPTDKHSAEAPAETHALENAVVRESVPPKPRKDGWDKASVAFAGLLVGIGAYGVLMAKRTLKAIERQALSMRYQTTHLRNSVIQARRAANAAKKSAEFSELATKLAECADVLLLRVGIVLNPNTQRLDGDAHVSLEFKNFGRTEQTTLRLLLPCNFPTFRMMTQFQTKYL